MNPEDLLRDLRNPANWNAEPTKRTDVFPARRRWAPLVVSVGTIAGIAVVATIAFAVFGLGVQNLRQQPAPPALATPTALPTAIIDPAPSPLTPSASDDPIGYPVTCENLLGASVLSQLQSRQIEVVDLATSGGVLAEDPTSQLRDFVSSGLVCILEGPGSSGAKQVIAEFAYRTLSSTDATAAKAALTRSSGHPSKTVALYTSSTDVGASFGFGDGFEIYVSADSGNENVYPALVTRLEERESMGSPLGRPATLTTEGFGEFQIGKPIADGNGFVAWTPEGCTGGAWIPDESTVHETGDVVSKWGFLALPDPKNSHTAPLARILVTDDSIPTVSGLRVGDKVGALTSAYSRFDATYTSPQTGAHFYEVHGTAGSLVFMVGGANNSFSVPADEIGAIGVVPGGETLAASAVRMIQSPCDG